MQRSLAVAQLVGFATLLRSVAYDRWVTVLVAATLVGGAFAAQRGRTWGLALAFAAAWWFPTAWGIGIAPAWFCLVGLAGVIPFMKALRPMARFDARATGFLAGITAATGMAGAMAWKGLAPFAFFFFPSVRPSIEAGHGVAVVALLAMAALAARMLNGPKLLGEDPRVRVALAEGASESSYTDAMSEEVERTAVVHEARARG